MPTSGETTNPPPAPEFPVEDRDKLAGALAPYLRAAAGVVPADLTDLDVLVDARPWEVIDALYAGGMLVMDKASDRAHLRASWAAMSTALFRLAKDQPLTPDVLAAVPASHRFYLLGHEASHRYLSTAWGQVFGARAVVEGILRRGTTPTPAQLGQVVATLGGVDPYAGDRPDDADSWWGCWTDPDADPEPFRWETYTRTCDADAVLDGLGDLCAFLGGSWSTTPGESSITGEILRLLGKAQATPERFAQIARAFPREASAWRMWMAMSPAPTAAQLCAALVDLDSRRPTVGRYLQASFSPDDVAAGLARAADDATGRAAAARAVARQGPVLASVDPETLERQINERAREYAGAIVVDPDGTPEVLRHALRPDLLSQLFEGARAYALPWPAGTRTVYDPVDGAGVEEVAVKAGNWAERPDPVVLWRDLFVEAADGHRCLLGRVRRLSAAETAPNYVDWWLCQWCNMGAVGAVSGRAARAERLGHEAICGDQDRIQVNVPRTSLPRAVAERAETDPDWVPGFGPVPGSSVSRDRR